MTVLAAGVSELVEGYDGVILDLWGVIHDGVVAYPDVIECLAALRAAGKRTLLLSNAPRRSTALIAQLSGMGIGRDMYDEALSSGDAVHQALERRDEADFATLGRRLYHLGPERDRNIFDDLDYEAVELGEADFVLNTGPVDLGESAADYRPILTVARARALPMICANPDREVIRQGKRIACAGALGDIYRSLGGVVIERGKPDPAIYDTALERLGIADRNRILAIGDALHTDIRGARKAGIASVLVVGGIHADELGITWGEQPDLARLDALIRRHGDRPRAALTRLVW
ncbi:TIGR01459 family HAD-type hydrolase [Magnetospirillum molischianum]|uniref:Predicted sugar phosphatase of the HAD superfamily n=1 Tax=Magnetospirillum molischianum DSM 120 TaxID=1150626 RepID=H8FX28_MAGML|nr:TIGR01459 family HAD-type hydrolase [Magnetospirillum molischianum]CCG42916.1 Predicted sugar phosphatase of the HAD superfamily [Magnetospirillum molischianum DSM 120]